MVKAAANAAAPRAERDWLISGDEKRRDLGAFLALLQTPRASVAPKPQLNLGSLWPVIFRRAVRIDLRDANGLNCLGLRARRDLFELQTVRPVENAADMRDGRLSPRGGCCQGRQRMRAHRVRRNRRRQVEDH